MKSSNPAAALLLSATLIAGALAVIEPAQAADQAKNVVSREFAKPLTAARTDLKNGRYRDAVDELNKARALPKPTAWEMHLINEMAAYAYTKINNLSEAARALEALLGDGFTGAAEANRYVKELASISFQLKDYGKTIDFGSRAIKGGFADASTYTAMSEAYYLKGDFRNAMKFTDGWVSDELKRGETPKEAQLQLILTSCERLEDQPCVTRSFERLVTYYPKPEYWQNLMDSLFRSKEAETSDLAMLNIYRLAYDVDAISKPQQYIEMAQLAMEQGFYGEGEQVLEKGMAKNLFTEQRDRERVQRLLASAKKQAAADQASLPKLAEEAAASPTGQKAFAAGMAYLSYNQYDKAADLLNQALMKGGLHNEAQARLLLGVAQLKSGKRDDAVKTFHKVKGDPTLEKLATLWSLHARGEDRTVASR
ncbi:MAG TPA: tetratricopeptide repeat protein [Steroidobacteraceae bacterium]|nr:tetratricopeptide repeat protein [Steroidobacteraceae bacterium]